MKKPISIINVIGFVLLIFSLILFMLFFKYVSIGEKISRESYDNSQDWFWNIGLFIAIMSGFYVFITNSIDLMFIKTIKYAKR